MEFDPAEAERLLKEVLKDPPKKKRRKLLKTHRAVYRRKWMAKKRAEERLKNPPRPRGRPRKVTQ